MCRCRVKKKGDYKTLAAIHVDTLYAYDEGIVLFKPTKAAAQQFRLSEPDAISYVVTGLFPEDHGFCPPAMVSRPV